MGTSTEISMHLSAPGNLFSPLGFALIGGFLYLLGSFHLCFLLFCLGLGLGGFPHLGGLSSRLLLFRFSLSSLWQSSLCEHDH